MSFWLTFVVVFYSICGVGVTGILVRAKEPIKLAPRAPKLTVALEHVTRPSGSPVGYI